MESTIAKVEAEMQALLAESQNPKNATDAKKLHDLSLSIASAQAEIERLYLRWSELEKL